MRYDFTVPTEDLKSMKKNEDRSLHTLIQSAHADMSARATRIQILVFVVNFKKMSNEDLF